MYPEEIIAQFKAGINKKEKEREKPKEKEKEATIAKGLFASPSLFISIVSPFKFQFLNLCDALNSPAPSNTKAALKSKIVAEFTVSQLCCVSRPRAFRIRSPTPVICAFLLQPQSLLEQLSKHKRAATEEELREKQLGALRVDLCSPEALKRLKGQPVPP